MGNQVVLFYEIRVKRGDDLSLQKTTIFKNATENKERILFKCANSSENGHDCEMLLHKLLLKVAKNSKVFSVEKIYKDSILHLFTLC